MAYPRLWTAFLGAGLSCLLFPLIAPKVVTCACKKDLHLKLIKNLSIPCLTAIILTGFAVLSACFLKSFRNLLEHNLFLADLPIWEDWDFDSKKRLGVEILCSFLALLLAMTWLCRIQRPEYNTAFFGKDLLKMANSQLNPHPTGAIMTSIAALAWYGSFYWSNDNRRVG